jgi:hypothetical protein
LLSVLASNFLTRMESITDRKLKIQLLVASDNVPEAVKRSMDYIRDFGDNRDNINAIVLISNHYHRIRRSALASTSDANDLNIQMNKVLMGMLELLNQVEDDYLLFNDPMTEN